MKTSIPVCRKVRFKSGGEVTVLEREAPLSCQEVMDAAVELLDICREENVKAVYYAYVTEDRKCYSGWGCGEGTQWIDTVAALEGLRAFMTKQHWGQA